MRERFLLWSAFALLAFAPAIGARPAEIILFRHAEKPADDKDPHLSARGQERAEALAKFLSSLPEVITNRSSLLLIAPHPTSHAPSRRCLETLGPTAHALDLRLQTPHAATEWRPFAKELLTNHAYDGKVVIVCWVHDYLPSLATALGVAETPDWPGKMFDRLWTITFPDSRPALKNSAQHFLPGDSKR